LVVASSLAGGALSAWLLRGLPQKSVQAKEFYLVDTEGDLRAVLGVHDDGNPHLTLWNATGEMRAWLSCPFGDPSLTLWDAAGEMRAALGLVEGKPSLGLRDAAGETRAAVGSTFAVDKRTGTAQTHPESTVTLFNADRDVIWQAP